VHVAVVAEYYPRPSHPGLGVWAHRQALAAREEGVEVRSFALERPIPPLSALRALAPGGGRPTLAPLREWLTSVRGAPRELALDGIPVRYVRFVSPPRPTSYGSWGRWASPPLARSLDAVERSWPIDLVHAHYAVPAGDAVLRWMRRTGRRVPLVVSVHGGDLTYAAPRSARGWRAVRDTLAAADAVIVNSSLTGSKVAELIGDHHRIEVVHAGSDLHGPANERHPYPALVTVANLEPHKSQADVIRAVAELKDRYPALSYVLVGKGPQRDALAALAFSLGVGDRVRFTGALPHEPARGELARCHLHVMPSRHEGFGVAHLDAMAAGVPTITGAGTGSDDIVMAGEGALAVQAGDLAALTRAIDGLLAQPDRLRALGEAARQTVATRFSWERCGRQTVALYREVARRSGAGAASGADAR
jgi:glycosyltransferase involved in cell wall biosynthesis